MRGRETVLVAEDEDLLRQLAEKILSQQGYRVLTARDGREALRIMEDRGASVDLLLTDIVMPDINGPSLAEQRRQQFPRLRVAYMSGYAQDALSGATDVKPGHNFIQKPFKPADLLALVREFLDAR